MHAAALQVGTDQTWLPLPLQVLSGGRLVEHGPPSELAQRPGGTFARLAQAAASDASARRSAT